MANKFDGDVRPLSNDPRYMGVVFQGSIEDALQQAHDAPDHGVAEQVIHPQSISRSRWNLLEHLNLGGNYSPAAVVARQRALMIEMAQDRLDFEDGELLDKLAAPMARPWDAFSRFSLEYAAARWPESFKS